MTPAPQPQEYIITEEQVKQIGEAMARNYLQDAGISLCRLLRSRPALSPETMTPQIQEQEYQCSFCTKNKYNGDGSCPLNLVGSNRNSDILDGINRVIQSCGCGSFVDTRSHPDPSPETITKGLALELCMDGRKEAAAQARNKTLTDVMEKIDYRFNDTERGRRTIETCREVIESLRGKP